MSNPSYVETFIIPEQENNSERESEVDKFHKFTLNNYLKKKMFLDEKKSEAIFQCYSSLFKSIISVSKGNEIFKVDNDEVIFEQIVDVLKSTQSSIPLFVKSYAGYGKTEFLSVLYLYLYYKYRNNQSDKLPVYISLHYYNKFIYPKNRGFTQQGENKLVEDLTGIFSYLQNHEEQEVIIIIDGTDEFHDPKVDLDDCVLNMIGNLPIKRQIIGLRSYVNKHTLTYRRDRLCLLNTIPEVEIELNRVSVESPNYQRLIESFSNIESMTICRKYSSKVIAKYIYDMVKKLGLKEIDYFHLFLFSKGLQSPIRYNGVKSLSSFYKKYLEECGIDVKGIAELAFKTFNRPKYITNEEKNSRIWWKIQKHDSLRDYLTAYNIVEKLIEYSESNDDIFNFVYPYELNVFCKEIINENLDNQKDALRSIEKLIKGAKLTAKTHFCYILGRFTNDDVKKDSVILLREVEAITREELRKRNLLDSTKIVKIEDKKYLLYYRTICISLICLKEKDASSNYIKQLLNNKYFDNLNRGFHLEYYEDIIFSPASPDSLKHEDDLGSFDKTFNRLHNKLFAALNSKKYYPLFQIELYTLCSLAQHRQANDNLDEEKRVSIAEIIEFALKQSECVCRDLQLYLLFMKDRLIEPGKFKVASFIKDFYSLKKMPRKGWVKRKVKKPETVASHIYGTLLLAYVHLPSSMEDDLNYDKKTIIKMLLIHDIGEAYIGDLTPIEKTSLMEEKEEQQLEYLNLIGTYDGISSELELFNLYKNFTYNQDDINCKIARDIDKLDNLLQLYIYNNESPVSGFDFFKNDLRSKIKTNVGRQIMEQIEELFV